MSELRAAVGLDIAVGEPDDDGKVETKRFEAGEVIDVAVPEWVIEQGLAVDVAAEPDAQTPEGDFVFDVAGSTVEEVLEFVGDDVDKARWALGKEQEPDVDTRVTLVGKLEKLAEGAE